MGHEFAKNQKRCIFSMPFGLFINPFRSSWSLHDWYPPRPHHEQSLAPENVHAGDLRPDDTPAPAVPKVLRYARPVAQCAWPRRYRRPSFCHLAATRLLCLYDHARRCSRDLGEDSRIFREEDDRARDKRQSPDRIIRCESSHAQQRKVEG